jgi:hypothetical protein
MGTEIVKKEDIPALDFVRQEVLPSHAGRIDRAGKLIRAMVLGNAFHEKCRIVFETTSGRKAVETTVWFSSDKYICLKGGVMILVTAIIDVVMV